MSTFDGHVAEFPDIQVDYFRSTPATARCRPLACFLSHVHSDHLVGLDSLRSPFVYCSAATRELVLQLERYPCRMNFATGILEARQRTYKDLAHVLKPLPLDTPTTIELSPGNSIQVTLLDANHCPGSVMFLFENEKKAALYTGDTRLEPWFVNALVRSPSLVEYVSGLRTLDTVYMDTTFLQKDAVFQTRSEGLRELVQAVAAYPADTVFYFRAWTFGYEDVWAALAKVLKSTVHVDAYTMGMYQSLTVKDAVRRFGPQFHLDPVAPRLAGFMCANTEHAGCLQTGDATARIHSCEHGPGGCSGVRDASVVWIRPVVCRLPAGTGDMAEAGAGGGGGDLHREAELEITSRDEVVRLCRLFPPKKEDPGGEETAALKALLYGALQSRRHIPIHLDVDMDAYTSQAADNGPGDLGIATIKDAVCDMVRQNGINAPSSSTTERAESLARSITFPYARHSSYQEQCDFLDRLRPRDVWPCTVHADAWFRSGEIVTIRDLFGRYCSGDVFRHDVEVAAEYAARDDVLHEVCDSQMTADSEETGPDMSFPEPATQQRSGSERSSPGLPYYYHSKTVHSASYADKVEDGETGQHSRASVLSALAREQRAASHQAVVHNAVDGNDWMHIGLMSTSDNHTVPDVDLGHG